MLDDKHLLKPWDAKKVGVACRPFPLRGPVSWGLLGPPAALPSFSTLPPLPSAVLILLPTSVLRSPWN